MALALFPPVVGLHGCAGMHDTTKQKLADELVARGYVLLLADRLCNASWHRSRPAHRARSPPSSGAGRMPTALSPSWQGQTFVDPQRVAVVGFSAGARVTLSVAEANSFEQFVPEGNLRFRAAAAFYPPLQAGRGASEHPDAHLHWGPRRLDAGGRLLR
jgi:dienelactone hydrolase